MKHCNTRINRYLLNEVSSELIAPLVYQFGRVENEQVHQVFRFAFVN